MSDRALSFLVYGTAGAGKTRFSTTGPKPLLLLDVEMASRFVKAEIKKIYWNPLTENPPVDDGTWDICVVKVNDWKKAEKAYEWLKSRNHPFKTVVVDSISELQTKAIEDINGRKQFQTQDWGKLLARMSFFCKDLRDLTGDDENIIEAVVVTAMARQEGDVLKPFLQGSVKDQIPYWFDITAYLYVTQEPDANGEVIDTRNLLVGRHPNFEAKSRVDGLPNVISTPNIKVMLDNIFGPE